MNEASISEESSFAEEKCKKAKGLAGLGVGAVVRLLTAYGPSKKLGSRIVRLRRVLGFLGGQK